MVFTSVYYRRVFLKWCLLQYTTDGYPSFLKWCLLQYATVIRAVYISVRRQQIFKRCALQLHTQDCPISGRYVMYW